MASMSPKERSDVFARALVDEGLLDNQINELLRFEEQTSGFLITMIDLFLDGVEGIISDLTDLLDQVAVDFERVNFLADKLIGSSARLAVETTSIIQAYGFTFNSLHHSGISNMLQKGIDRIGKASLMGSAWRSNHVPTAAMGEKKEQGYNGHNRCIRSLNEIKNEYHRLQPKLKILEQLSRAL